MKVSKGQEEVNLRVLHLLPTTTFSGAENVVCQIINMLNNDAETDMIYCCPKGQISKILLDKNVNHLCLNNFTVKEIKQAVRMYNPNLIHSHDVKAGIFAILAAYNIPIISHIHGNDEKMRILSIKSITFGLTSFKFKHVFWVSQSSFKHYIFKNFLNKKSSMLYNVINVQDVREKANYPKLTKEKKYEYDIIFLGRLSYAKNPQRLIKVIGAIKENKNNIKVGIIGDGELMGEVKKLILKLNLEENIFLTGFLNNPLTTLIKGKIMLMTSRFEGTPMCALEAMALGIPIVSTPTDGLNDIIDDGVNGYLSCDDSTLAQKSFELITNDNKRQEFSTKCLEKIVEINDINLYCEKIKNVYNDCIKKR